MTIEESAPAGDRQIRTKIFHGTYLVAAVVATLGWGWALGYFALGLLGY